MKIPAIKGLIKRRLLLNYRVDPEIVAGILPDKFSPKLFNGYAIAGICLIRLESIRPKGLPAMLGINSENSAHRIAVQWQDDQGEQEGVYIPRRDTDSKLNALAGGRIFPGVHHLSAFNINDKNGNITINIESKEGCLVDLNATETDQFPQESIFDTLDQSSQYFEAGCIGYSARPDSCKLDGLLLKVDDWQVTALSMEHISSAYFDDPNLFPQGSITFDHGLLMRDIDHEWHSID